MGRAGFNQKTEVMANVAAGTFAAGGGDDDTFYYYTDMRDHRRSAMQYVMAGSGTQTLTVEATVEETSYSNATELATKAASLTWTDISSTYLGTDTKTADGMTTDSAGVSGTVTFIRAKVVVASSDTDTAYSVKINKTE